MMVKIVENFQEWEQFNLAQPFSLFTQSAAFGSFHAPGGSKSLVFGVYNEKGEIIGGTLVICIHARRGSFLMCPYGPILPDDESQARHALSILVDALCEYGKKHGFDFVRMSPFAKLDSPVGELFKKDDRIKKAPMHILAENTWMLNISNSSEEELLSQMKKNHRNLIRRCNREKVVVTMTKSDEALKRLNSMHDTVVERHNFTRFSKRFVTDEFHTFAQKDQAYIFEATLPDGRVDGSAIIMFYGNMACYRHSASLHLDKRLPTAYLIQWNAILEAKKRGMMWYNFWGIAPEGATKDHPFYGITHFKKGFGGERRDLVECLDIPLSKKYLLNYIIERVRKVRRGFSQ